MPNFTLQNTTQDLYSISDSQGFFEIQANVGDSIVLQSIAYEKYVLEVEQRHFGDDIVIELKPENLDEVLVYSSKTDGKTLGNELKASIKNDIIENPGFYEPSKGNIGYVLHKIFQLFEKDDKPEHAIEDKKLTSEDFIALFRNDEVLNETFLEKELQIPQDYHLLFLDYLGSKGVSRKYLEKDRKLELIDLIFKYNTEYRSKIDLSENENPM